jgi:VWFA-related protein
MAAMRTRLAVTAVAAIAALALGAVAAQEPQPPQTFRSAVDVVSVDVSVIGEGGKPVTGLDAGDFVVTVDGRPRRVASAQFVPAVREAKPSPASPGSYSTNAASGGRLILLLIDQGSIGRGRGRAAMESVSRFVSQLSPADRVGLIAFPGAGPQIEFTQNHESVRAGLARLVGQAETFQTTFRIGVFEAIAVQQGDRAALGTLVQRECGSLLGGEDLESCRSRLQADASGIASLVRERTQNSLAVLRAVTDRLASTPSPKTILYLSEGLILENLSEVGWLGPAALRGQATIQVLHLDAPAADASIARESVNPGRDRAIGRDGLGAIAGLTRGGLFDVAGGADAALDRLALELSGYYLLGVEPEPNDRDGRPHKIKVDLPGRSGMEIRARLEFSVGAAAARSEEADLTDTLKAPIVASDIGLKLAAFTLRDPESEKLRVLMVAEIDRGVNAEGRLALAYVLFDDKGRAVTSQIDRDVKAPVHPSTKVQRYSTFILSETSGPHRLKLAVLDDKGRRGSVEHTFTPSLTLVGQIHAADLLVADSRPEGGPAVPMVSGELTSGMLTGYLELYADQELLKNATVFFEVAENEQGRALDGAAGKVQAASADSPNRRSIEGTIPTALLPPGDYVARAVVSADGRRIGQVTRTVRVGRVVAETKASSIVSLRPRSSRPAAITLVSKPDRFERTSVLTPEVVGFFMERLNFADRGEPNAGPVIEHASAGRFDDAVQSLTTRSGTVPAAFLGGLALYSKGELEPAAAKFREALRLDSEFFAAAFYLGSCYAAGGRDSQAVGAWRLSLVTQNDAPFIYTLLADALLRERDVNQALQVLNEAAAMWPDNDEVDVRLGAAYAAEGRRADALEKFQRYLEKHPAEHERTLSAMKVIYEARAAGKPVRSIAEDRALFAKWAAAYASAKGPNQALVDQWQRVVNR